MNCFGAVLAAIRRPALGNVEQVTELVEGCTGLGWRQLAGQLRAPKENRRVRDDLPSVRAHYHHAAGGVAEIEHQVVTVPGNT